MNDKKLSRVLQSMKENDIPQMIVADPPSIYYLTGKMIHPGERLLALYLNVNGKHVLVNNELFPIEEDLGVEIVYYNDIQDSVEILAKYIQKDLPVGVDKVWPSKFLLKLMEIGAGSKFLNGSFLVDYVRMIKDEEELELLRKASQMNDKAMERLIPHVLDDLTEDGLHKVLLEIYSDLGSEGESFEGICAYGGNAADPHHLNDNVTVPKKGDSVILDIGCIKNKYCSDMTRTVFYEEVSDKAREVYETVLEANLRGIAAVKPGARFCDIDLACRDYIESKGYGKYFTHRTGHCIGMEDHEYGDVSSVNTDVIKPGMVFSIEPGIYLPGEVGVRIEDLVIVTEDGCENLNKIDKSLKIMKK